jgi:hypothetical protein
LETILRRLLAIEGVIGAVLTGKDGLVVASTLEGEEEELLGAMGAAAFDAAGRYIEQLGGGEIRHATFETPGGIILVTEGGEMLIIVRCAVQANLGRVRMEAGAASLRLSEQIGSY